MNLDAVVRFVFEIGHLKRQKHEGWRLSGVEHPDSIADHALRTAQIAFILAVLEGADPYKAACMGLIHDNAEARVQDVHKVAARYVSAKEGEKQAFTEQVENLPDGVRKPFIELFDQYELRNTPEGIIAKDADWLETAFQARQYQELGHNTAEIIENVEKALETDSAKELIASMKKSSFTDWWQGLKKMTYKKLK